MSYAEDSTVLVTHAHVEHGTAANKTEVEPPLPVDYYRYTVKHVEIFKVFLNFKLFQAENTLCLNQLR